MNDACNWLEEPMRMGFATTRRAYAEWLIGVCARPRPEGDRLFALEPDEDLREGIRALVKLLKEVKR